MGSLEDKRIKLEFHKSALEKLREAYIALVDGGVQSYSIGSRSLSKLDIAKIMEEIKYHEKEISGLEAELNGGRRRKAVGIVPRDW